MFPLSSLIHDDCAIVYSVPGSSVARTGGQFHPPVKSVSSIVVKKEPLEIGAPCSPSLWGDFTSPEDAAHAHNVFVRNFKVYTPKTVSLLAADIPSSSGVKDENAECIM